MSEKKTPRPWPYLVLAATLGALLSGSLYAVRIPFNFRPAYNAVHIGMPRTQAASILAENGVRCGLTEAGENYRVCSFDDIWRTYKIVLDPKNERVALKTQSSRGPVTLQELFRKLTPKPH